MADLTDFPFTEYEANKKAQSAMTDAVLKATLIAQNGGTRGEIIYDQTKSCSLVNWNPATNGDAAYAESLRRSDVRLVPTPNLYDDLYDDSAYDTASFKAEVERMCTTATDPSVISDLRQMLREAETEQHEQQKQQKSSFIRGLLSWGGFALFLYLLNEAARYWVFHG
jgi:hypothetical protein